MKTRIFMGFYYSRKFEMTIICKLFHLVAPLWRQVHLTGMGPFYKRGLELLDFLLGIDTFMETSKLSNLHGQPSSILINYWDGLISVVNLYHKALFRVA